MEFQPEKESWDCYTERLQHFFSATKMVNDEQKVFTLIHQNGPSLYTLLKELSYPQNPTQMSYDALMQILRRHYVGAKNVYYERKMFYGAQMTPYESASEWHRRLRSLVINCEFGSFIEEILVDKFVTGFNGKVLHRLYEQDENLSMQQALDIAQRYENDSDKINENRRGKERTPSEVRQKASQQRSNQQQNKSLQQQQIRQQQQTRQQQQQQPRQQQQQPRQQQQYASTNVLICYKCGKNGHYANVCRSEKKKEDEEGCCIS